MLRRLLRFLALGILAAVAGVAFLLMTNPAPAVPAIVADVADSRPYLIKLHARWCSICMMTKDEWAKLEQTYGQRVRLVVLDFTTDAATETSRGVAAQLGLTQLFDEYVGETGTVLVVDGRSKDVRHSLHGNLEWAEYAAAVDDVLAPAVR